MEIRKLITNNKTSLVLRDEEMTAHRLQLVAQVDPSALTLVDEDKVVQFRVAVCRPGYESMSQSGVSIPTTSAKKETINFEVPIPSTWSEELVDALGINVQINLNKVFAQVNTTLDTIKDAKLGVL